MTGIKMLETAMNLLGYTSSNGGFIPDSRTAVKGLTVLNLIYRDLKQLCDDGEAEPLKALNEEILLDDRALNDVMPYGVAMLMAQSESDGDSQQLYAALYNRKRTGLSRSEVIEDVIPRSEY